MTYTKYPKEVPVRLSVSEVCLVIIAVCSVILVVWGTNAV